jgi:hypothetical protein
LDPLIPGYQMVFNRISGLPNLTPVKFWNTVTNNWEITPGLSISNQTQGGQPLQLPMSNVRSVTARLTVVSNTPLVAIMIALGDGVYEVTYNPAAVSSTPTNTPGFLPVSWYITNEAYRTMRRANELASPVTTGDNPLDLRAMYAKRLDNGDVLIVNGYIGKTTGGNAFSGEVVELNGGTGGASGSSSYGYGYNMTATNLGFGRGAIRFTLNTSKSIRGLVLPTFADRR